jgi:hypothetical protein
VLLALLFVVLGLLLTLTTTDAFLAKYVIGWIAIEVLICDLALDHSGADLLLELRVITESLQSVSHNLSCSISDETYPSSS